ncbi:RNA-binding KH domain-containing protein PEPPER-like [Iris pallida]|uniref:RNA-binding KH domain-containing protein PEPPER-like n=1 Tax=Iris pallida TaxID=29817 RepID=A0AAX6GJ85_IRIPA|nr:RNA-binding KH domain-containing protein PEPPER-like [Iris pallida]
MAATSTDANGPAPITETASAPAAEVVEMEMEHPAEEEEEEVEEVEEEEEEGEGEETEAPAAEADESKRWPGWPGNNVFRMVVPVTKVGGIIGKKGEFIKKLCEETRAKIRILEGVVGTTDRIVLISAKEEPEAEISPAMDAVLKVFKRLNGISDGGGDGTTQASVPTCSVRLLVAGSQAINLIGKQGSSIKAIQESTGATIRVLSGDELPFYATGDERVVDFQGDSLKVTKALEAVVGHLRKFLVDHSVLPLFEKNLSKPAAQDRSLDSWADKSLINSRQQPSVNNDYQLPLKRDSLFLDRVSPLDSHMSHPGFSSMYRQDPPLSDLQSSGLGRSAAALVTQVTQTMQIPLSYAEDIIGVRGANIAYIRRTSGAALTVQEGGGLPDEITVEIKGTSTQVQTAQQLIQDFISGGPKEPAASSYDSLDAGLRSSYSHPSSATYPSSSLPSSYVGYSSGYGGYGSGYRF